MIGEISSSNDYNIVVVTDVEKTLEQVFSKEAASLHNMHIYGLKTLAN